jgi:UDP-hydrolysing UDP-N-acetyl-D-glucosamine 2-epimerase
MKKKICVVVTARPSYSRVKTALRAIQKHSELELQLVVAASALLEKQGQVVKYMEEEGFNVCAKVYNVLEGHSLSNMAKTTALGILELSSVFSSLEPDVVVTIADRYETLSTAVAAAYMNIPLVHIQGGEVTGSIDDKVRHAITKLADYHFVATKQAKVVVEQMGEWNDRVVLTGCPSLDLAHEVLHNPDRDFDFYKKYGGTGKMIDTKKPFLVVMQHPVTTEFDFALEQTKMTLNAVLKSGIPTVWFWPNIDAGSDATSKAIRVFREEHHDADMFFLKNMDSKDFLHLLNNAACLIGNSSVGIRECSTLGVPVVNIGTRQSSRERGYNVVDVDYNEEAIFNAIQQQVKHGKHTPCHIYGNGNSGEQMADILASLDFKIKAPGFNLIPQ